MELRYALRTLLKNRVLSLTVIATLALGIGSCVAVFSVLKTVLLDPLPYEEPHRLAAVWERNLSRGYDEMATAPPNYHDWKTQSRSFENMGSFADTTTVLQLDQGAEQVNGIRITSSLFDTLRASPVLGRIWSPSEDLPLPSAEETIGESRPGQSGGGVAVISGRLWRRLYGERSELAGASLIINERRHEIVGVMGDGFQFPPPMAFDGRAVEVVTDVYVPFRMDMANGQRGAHFMRTIGRLGPGISFETAQAELDSISARLAAEYPSTNEGWDAVVVPLREEVLGPVEQGLWVLQAAVVMVLLIGCVNVTNLLLAHFSRRRQEFALRSALGAGRARVLRQLLVESLVLSLVGGAAGLLLAFWGITAIVGVAPKTAFRLSQVGIDVPVMLFAVGVSLAAGLICVLAVAWDAFKIDLRSRLSEGTRSVSESLASQRLRALLVAGEIALSLVLLIGAGLMMRSFVELLGKDTGVRAENAVTMRVRMPSERAPDSNALAAAYEALRTEIESQPWVSAAGFVHDVPLADGRQGTGLAVTGRDFEAEGIDSRVHFTFATPGYFEAMGIPLLRGRAFETGDGRDAEPVVLISQEVAERIFAGDDPVGRQIRLGFSSTPRRIVGIVGNVQTESLRNALLGTAYVPYAQQVWSRPMALAVRSTLAPPVLIPQLRDLIHRFDPAIPVSDPMTMTTVVSESASAERFSALMLGTFSMTALLLAAVGIYGVVSVAATLRTREAGVRMALGAQPLQILALILRGGLGVALIGVAVGLPVAYLVGRLLESQLYGVAATDPMTFILLPAVLLVVVAVASAVPAFRASRIDPVQALRE